MYKGNIRTNLPPTESQWKNLLLLSTELGFNKLNFAHNLTLHASFDFIRNEPKIALSKISILFHSFHILMTLTLISYLSSYNKISQLMSFTVVPGYSIDCYFRMLKCTKILHPVNSVPLSF